jgi:hypothetical protein
MIVRLGEDVICAFMNAGHAGTEMFVEKKMQVKNRLGAEPTGSEPDYSIRAVF